MAIKVGRTVIDRLTQRIGEVIARHAHLDGTVTVTVRPGGDPDLDFDVDEWRLDEVPGVTAAAFGRAVRRFITSDVGSPLTVKLSILVPYLYGLITGAAVVFYRCHCS